MAVTRNGDSECRLSAFNCAGGQKLTQSAHRTQLMTSVAVGVALSVFTACGSSANGRVVAANDLFSVAIPAGWHQAPVVAPSGGASYPDEGALRLVGPGNRAVQISWIDGSYSNGFIDATDNVVRNIPVTLGGQSAIVADHQTTSINGVRKRLGLLSGVSHTVHGRQVGFVATCEPGSATVGDYSWCVAILDSWRWGSSAP